MAESQNEIAQTDKVPNLKKKMNPFAAESRTMKTNKMNLIPSTCHPRHLAALALGVLWLAGSPARAATSANNVFWLDASAITGLANGQSVTSWLDRSGQGNHATGVVGTSGTGLTYNPAGLNGKGTVSFDQVDDYFLVTNSASLAVSNHTFFFVANVPNKTAASGNGTKGLLQKRDGGGTNYCLNYGLAEASSPRFERAKLYNSAAGDSGSVARASRDPSADGGAVFDFRDGNVIGTARLAGTDSSIDNTAISLFWKGLEETTYTLQTAGPTSGPFVNTNDMVIGTQSYNQTTNIWFYGSMGELLLFNTALTGTEITDVSAYLSQKWGIALASGVTGDAVAGALLVGSPIPTTSALQSSLNPSTNGNSVTFTATVQTNGTATAMAGNAGGTMVFKAGATTLGSAGVTNGVATFATSALPVRTNSISAQYSGDPNYAANVSSVLPQLVYPVSLTASSTMLISSTNSAPFATVVTFTATVQTNGTTATDAIGTVVFKDAGTPLATNNVSVGVAQWTTDGLAVGSHSMTAEYSGDIVYQPSTTITPWT